MINEFNNIGIFPKGNYIEQKLKCPQCYTKRKNKHDRPLSINTQKGVYNCHNCGWSGKPLRWIKEVSNTTDEDIIKAEHKIAYLETVIKYIDGVLRSIQSRGWDIKNAISWKQFEAGMI